ncbi:hypothetical protein [Citreicella sp. C3M06]|uniref:GspE/PulE/PilB domain-containing protein n=1 Tax=Citreicella sp. C3M06 TaxID=2841564 RepID=UPI002090D6CD|nr:hypothetical protein [Citreicella sp. C3M06]
MNSPSQGFRSSQLAQASSPRGRPISAILLANGSIAPSDAMFALVESFRSGAALPQVLLAEDLATPQEILEAQAQHYGAMTLTPGASPPESHLLDIIDPETCLRLSCVPWMRIGKTLVVATSRPDLFNALIDELPDHDKDVAMALALESDLHDVIAQRHGTALARRAETQVPAHESCRDMDRISPIQALLGAGFALSCLALLFVMPAQFFAGATVLAIITLLFAQGLKFSALLAGWRRPGAPLGAHLRGSPALPACLDSGAAVPRGAYSS